MPQIFLILDQTAQEVFSGEDGQVRFAALDNELTGETERVLGIEGEGDVACTAVGALYTRGEANVQIEVRLTVGEDEYDRGVIFDPPREVKEELARELYAAATQILDPLTVSLWPKPFRDTVWLSAEE